MFRNGGGRARVSSCLLLALLAAPGMTACGGQTEDAADDANRAASSSSPSDPAGTSESAPPGSPACADVWAEGAPLPRSYQGCTEETGGYVKRDVLGCSSGQRMVSYGDLYYGVLGGTIHEASTPLDRDRDYRAAVRSCRA